MVMNNFTWLSRRTYQVQVFARKKRKILRYMKMHEAILSGTWRKIIFIMFISGTILLTLSYYDYDILLRYQVSLAANLSKEDMTIGRNRTQVAEPAKSVEPEDENVEKSELAEYNNLKGPAKYLEPDADDNEETSAVANINLKDDEEYLVSSSKCKIIKLDPFSQDAKKYFKPVKYKTCNKNKLLTYVTREDNIATVHIDNEIIPHYTKAPVSCCYSDVKRSTSTKTPDDSIKLSDCTEFQNNVTITQEAILVKCTEHGSKKRIYENVHTSIRKTKDVQSKIKYYDNSTNKPISVLFVGIDSISRLNFIRALPKTYQYVEDNGWIPLKGYNKMDDNTFPNLMAILTGFNQSTAYKTCKPKNVGFLDKCPILWYNYRNLGYVTGYAEDEAVISTFNYNKKGFIRPPTDYYFRPYIMATEKLNKVTVSSMAYCTGPETAGERILNLVKDFGTTFKDHPHFGFFWMNTFSHNEISTPNMMDDKLKTFLTDLDSAGVTNNTLIIFLSDHGIRFGEIRMTQTGWLEERLPFIYFSFPPWFKDRFPKEYNNFRNNVNKLTTPYDLHMTLQNILTMSGLNYTIKPSDGCPNCVSLFGEVPEVRSCEDAGITEHWCTCAGYSEKKLDILSEKRVANFFIDQINGMVSKRAKDGGNKCAKYTIDEVRTRLSYKFSYKNTSYALVILKTHPKAVFETTVSFTGDIMNSTLKSGDISRLDYYNSHSTCVSDAYLKKYCYCR